MYLSDIKMLEKKTIAVMTAGAGAGIAQTFILREYVDKQYGLIPGLEGLGGFGTYSAMGGLIAGGVTTALGLVSVLTGKITTNETIQIGLIGYGIPALSGGILSAVFPHPAVGLRLRAAAPAAGRAPAGLRPAPQVNLRSAGVQRPPVASQPRPGGVSQSGAIPLRT